MPLEEVMPIPLLNGCNMVIHSSNALNNNMDVSIKRDCGHTCNLIEVCVRKVETLAVVEFSAKQAARFLSMCFAKRGDDLASLSN